MEFSADKISGETIAGETVSSTSCRQKEFVLVKLLLTVDRIF